ncbi:MAG: AbrB/MazE/SpoVT family DNA-binding domain-containing protein [Armatimonadota bacterium]
MHEVTISPKFQIVIPKAVRERLHFRAGQKLGVLIKGNTVSLVQVRPLRELKGIAKGANMEGYREEEDRF